MDLNTSVKFVPIYTGVKTPYRATAGSAGADIYCQRIIRREHFGTWGKITYGTGLRIEIPMGFFGDIRPRSSIRELDLLLTNSCGIIDWDYRGEIQASFLYFVRHRREPIIYLPGDRFLQLVIVPYEPATFRAVEVLSETARGENGHGSSGVS